MHFLRGNHSQLQPVVGWDGVLNKVNTGSSKAEFSWEIRFLLKFFNVYLLLRNRESEREKAGRRGAERERERESQNPKETPGSELSAQSLTQGSNP